MVRARAIAGFVVVGLVAVACADVLGIESLSNAVPPPVDAGPDTYRDPCTSPPGPIAPVMADESGADQRFALSSIDFGVASDVLGFNLDLACSSDRDSGTCVPGTGGSAAVVDGPNGIDNSLAGFFGGPLNVGSAVRQALNDGVWTLLFRLEGWSGKDDDPSVTLRVATGTGRSASAVPNWDIDALSVDGGIAGAVASKTGWVAKRVLRASFDKLTFVGRSSGLGTFVVSLSDAYVIGTIQNSGQIDGVLAGRWRANDVLVEVARLRLPVFGCVWQKYAPVSSICPGRDIMAASTDDKKGFECDSNSFAFKFTAGAATFADPPIDAGALSPIDCIDAGEAHCN